MNATDEVVTDDYAREVCKIGQGHECCRYLTMGAMGWSCEKHSPLRKLLDDRVAKGTINAQGDNCPGRKAL